MQNWRTSYKPRLGNICLQKADETERVGRKDIRGKKKGRRKRGDKGKGERKRGKKIRKKVSII